MCNYLPFTIQLTYLLKHQGNGIKSWFNSNAFLDCMQRLAKPFVTISCHCHADVMYHSAVFWDKQPGENVQTDEILKSILLAAVDSVSNDYPRLRHLNTWPPFGGASCEGCGTPRTLAVGRTSLGTDFEKLQLHLTSCSLSLCLVKDVISQLPATMLPSNEGLSLWNHKPKQTFP